MTSDPIFEIDYFPSAVHFDSLPNSHLLPQCKGHGTHPPKSWTLYAQYEDSEVRAYIIGNVVSGGLTLIRGSSCETDAAWAALRQGHRMIYGQETVPQLTDEQVKGLFHNALVRYAQAFGGKANFLRWLDNAVEEMRKSCTGPKWECEPFYSGYPLLERSLSDFRGSM